MRFDFLPLLTLGFYGATFVAEYAAYARETKRLVPGIF
jgi:protein-S-isoprenylcysteine O-methyltransferase Ste14